MGVGIEVFVIDSDYIYMCVCMQSVVIVFHICFVLTEPTIRYFPQEFQNI